MPASRNARAAASGKKYMSLAQVTRRAHFRGGEQGPVVDELGRDVPLLGRPDVLLQRRHQRPIIGEPAISVIAACVCRSTRPGSRRGRAGSRVRRREAGATASDGTPPRCDPRRRRPDGARALRPPAPPVSPSARRSLARRGASYEARKKTPHARRGAFAAAVGARLSAGALDFDGHAAIRSEALDQLFEGPDPPFGLGSGYDSICSVLPKPIVSILAPSTPLATRYAFTASARRSESF